MTCMGDAFIAHVCRTAQCFIADLGSGIVSNILNKIRRAAHSNSEHQFLLSQGSCVFEPS